MRPIMEVAEELGLDRQALIPYGPYKAKVHLDAVRDGGAPTSRTAAASTATKAQSESADALSGSQPARERSSSAPTSWTTGTWTSRTSSAACRAL